MLTQLPMVGAMKPEEPDIFKPPVFKPRSVQLLLGLFGSICCGLRHLQKLGFWAKICQNCHYRPHLTKLPLKFVDMKAEFKSKKTVGRGDVEASAHFKEPLSLAEMENLSCQSFAQNTENKIMWAVELYRSWWRQRVVKPDCDSRIIWASIDNLKQVSKGNLCFALSAFIGEVKKQDLTEYPGSTLYQIILCIQFFCDKNGLKHKLLDDEAFVPLRFTLDNIMKERSRAGIGEKKSSDVITMTDEESMWAKGVLGDSSPEVLRDTLMYLLGINLALRGGKNIEHFVHLVSSLS